MKKILSELKQFLQCRSYVLIVGLAAICSYGFAMMHPAIGMDDTAIYLYFEEGMAPYVGRWTLYMLNKVLPLDYFAPWMMELVSVLIFCISVTLWCVLFWRICKDFVDIPKWCYGIAAAIFLSSPLINEVFVFYLHNGICLSYGLIALSLLFLLNMLERGMSRKQIICSACASAVSLTCALGCYESFAIVYTMGAVMCFFLIRRWYCGEKMKYSHKPLPWLFACSGIGIAGVLLRSIILAVIKGVYGLSKLDSYHIAYRSLLSGIFQAPEELVMELKRFWMKYYVNGIVYLPIAVLVLAIVFIGIYAIYYGIRKKDAWFAVCEIALVLFPIFMCILEGIATRYRTAQFVPIMGAFAVFLLLMELHAHRRKPILAGSIYLMLGILLFNQCADMNRWFYVEYKKYEDVKEVLNQTAYELEKNHDTSKPIILKGAYKVPYEIAKDAYCSFSSRQYQWICRISDIVDPHLKEKYYAENGRGYIFTETPITSVLQWGLTAFDGTAAQIFNFWEMHGYSFICETDLDKIEQAEELRKELQMPAYPQEGYIQDCGEYILVNLESQ